MPGSAAGKRSAKLAKLPQSGELNATTAGYDSKPEKAIGGTLNQKACQLWLYTVPSVSNE